MSVIEWGPEIPVDGKRPAWLEFELEWETAPRHSVPPMSMRCADGYVDDRATCGIGPEFDWWGCDGDDRIVAIRLPADHWAYRAIEKGFEPWGGGAGAPADWDGDEVLRRGGGASRPKPWIGSFKRNQRWWHEVHGCMRENDIIGYRKRAIPVNSDTVTIQRMTEAEARQLCSAYALGAVNLLRDLGLIREETIAERFARETGHEITPAVEAALTWGRDAA